MGRAHPSQFHHLVEYMERHGDLQTLAQDKIETLTKWNELTNILNKLTKEERRTTEKWRKTWSDLKNNTKKKAEKLRQRGQSSLKLTSLEKRVLKVVGYQYEENDMHLDNSDMDFKIPIVLADPDNSPTPANQSYFPSLDGSSTTQNRHKSESSSSSMSSLDNFGESKSKRRKSADDSVQEITNRFFEYEREKDRRAHEQEMARLKQNEQLLSLLGRFVNVIENLAPSIQKYIDNSSNSNS